MLMDDGRIWDGRTMNALLYCRLTYEAEATDELKPKFVNNNHWLN